MDKLFENMASEYGIFAALFVVTLYVFARYVDRNHKELVEMNNGLGKRLNEVERYVKESLVDLLIDHRAVIAHSTKVNEIAIRELERRCPDCEMDMTDSQIINKRDLKDLSDETKSLNKVKKDWM